MSVTLSCDFDSEHWETTACFYMAFRSVSWVCPDQDRFWSQSSMRSWQNLDIRAAHLTTMAMEPSSSTYTAWHTRLEDMLDTDAGPGRAANVIPLDPIFHQGDFGVTLHDPYGDDTLLLTWTRRQDYCVRRFSFTFTGEPLNQWASVIRVCSYLIQHSARNLVTLHDVSMPISHCLAIAALRMGGDDYSASILYDQAAEKI